MIALMLGGDAAGGGDHEDAVVELEVAREPRLVDAGNVGAEQDLACTTWPAFGAEERGAQHVAGGDAGGGSGNGCGVGREALRARR